MSDAVKKEIEGKGIELNNKNFREYATNLRKEKGMDIVAKMCLPDVREIYEGGKGSAVLIDGVRSYEEVEMFKNEFKDDFVLVSVFAPPKMRFERALKRGKSSDMKTWEEFEWRDNTELGGGLGKVMALSSHVVDNSGSMDELHEGLDKLIPKITG
jgi:dephospho-CoA kinase